MSGLVKAKEYDWKDSNMALFGSDTEKQVKKDSAMSEPAWEGAGTEVGLKIWRINKFQVEPVPEETYGDFFNGDSYIVLNTYKDEESDQLLYDVHFWIGKNSTQDEYGTAAYKTVELDTFLDDAAIQHREVEGFESPLFKSYFKQMTLLDGGHDSGFRHVEAETYQPRLFRFNNRRAMQVKAVKKSVTDNPGDVFVYDNNTEILQYFADGCSVAEKTKAREFVSSLLQSRGNASEETVSESKFLDCLEDGDLDEPVDDASNDEVKLLKVSDSDGSIGMEDVKSGDVSTSDLDSNDVFLIHTKVELVVWVGNGASPAEKKNGLGYAQKYLCSLSKGALVPISVLNEGDSRTNKRVEMALAA